MRSATGVARPVAGTQNSKLEVSFFRPFWGDYWILALDTDYQYALVGSPSRDYLWVLARTPNLDEQVYEQLLAVAESEGFDIARLVRTPHAETSAVGRTPSP